MRVVLSVVEKHSDMPVKKYVCHQAHRRFLLKVIKYLNFILKKKKTVSIALSSSRNCNSLQTVNLQQDHMPNLLVSQAAHC